MNGADVNARDARGETPLYLAYCSLGTELGRLLLKYCPDTNAKDVKRLREYAAPVRNEKASADRE